MVGTVGFHGVPQCKRQQGGGASWGGVKYSEMLSLNLKFPEWISLGERKDMKCHLHLGHGRGEAGFIYQAAFLCADLIMCSHSQGGRRGGLRMGHPKCCLLSEAQGTLRAKSSKINHC